MIIYLRIGKKKNGYKVEASMKPSHAILDTGASGESLPTISFAIDVNLPVDAFAQAEHIVAHLDIQPGQLTANRGISITNEDL